MANLTIFGLTQLTSAGADIVNDLVPVWDNDVAETKKMTLSDLRNLMYPANWSDSFSSATQATSSWTPNNAAANVNAAIIPKGTGAITAAIPDGTVTGGNARGSYAVDFQMIRNNANQVASGGASAIVAGQRNRNESGSAFLGAGTDNRITGTAERGFLGAGESNAIDNGGSHVIVGGQSNAIAFASHSFIGGGQSNSTNNGHNAIAGGRTNALNSQSYQFIGGGQGNTGSGTHSVISGGQSNTASQSHAVVSGGQSNTASAIASTVVGGYNATASLYGQVAHASGRFAANGDAQAHELIWRRAITGTAQTELFLDGASVAAILPGTNSVWNGIIDVSAVCTATGDGSTIVGHVEATSFKVTIKRIGTTTSLVGTVQEIGTTNADASMATAVFTIDNNDTNESLRVLFTPPGTAGSTTVIRAIATFRGQQIQY